MTQAAAITSLMDAETRFGLIRVDVESGQFFQERPTGLPGITSDEKTVSIQVSI